MEQIVTGIKENMERDNPVDEWLKNGLENCHGVIGTSKDRFDEIVKSGEIVSSKVAGKNWSEKYGHIPEYRDESFIFYLPFKDGDEKYNQYIIASAKNYGIETACEDLTNDLYGDKRTENINDFLDNTSFVEIRNSENVEIRKKLIEILKADGFTQLEIDSYITQLDTANTVLIGLDKEVANRFEISESNEAEEERKIRTDSITTNYIKGLEYV